MRQHLIDIRSIGHDLAQAGAMQENTRLAEMGLRLVNLANAALSDCEDISKIVQDTLID